MSTPRRRLVTASPSLRFLGLLKQPDHASRAQELELDERDVVWSSSSSATSSPSSSTSSPSHTPSPSASLRRPISAPSPRHFPAGSMGLSALLADDHHQRAPTAPVPVVARPERQQQQRAPQPHHRSAPVAVPAWPKAVAVTDGRRRGAELLQAADDDDDGDPVVPPHEMAARRAAAAASVMEGVGRTLKGRDLRRVRNAVWRTTGFLDL